MERRRPERKLGKRGAFIGVFLAIVFSCALHWFAVQHSTDIVLERMRAEAKAVVEMTNGFVRSYSVFSLKYTDGKLPNPAVFRADALTHVTQSLGDDTRFFTGVVGVAGREIARSPTDDVMRRQLLELVASKEVGVISSVFTKDGNTSHRSLWSFEASEQACVDCHNEVQQLSGDDKWQVGDIMGAQVVEQNIEPQLLVARRTATIQAALFFAAFLASWFWIIYLLNHFRLTRQLKTLASTDPLTGCINRRELQARIAEGSGPKSGALLMLDLDKFKLINDNHGHDVGDKVLQDFTQRVQSNLRQDDWFARFGGEEFVVWLPNMKAVDAILAAERIRNLTEQSEIIHNGSVLRYTVSIGLQIVQNSEINRFESWIKAADELVYRAKMQGRNRVVAGEKFAIS